MRRVRRGEEEEQQEEATADLMVGGDQLLNVSHLSSYECGSDVEAGVLRVRDPLLVDLHQLPDALQQFTFIEQLQKDKTVNSADRGRVSCVMRLHINMV